MVEYENECVGCPQGCICCGRERVAHFYCDECGDECTLYKYDTPRGERELCKQCLIDYIMDDVAIVEGSEV